MKPAPEFRRIPPAKPDGMSAVASEHWDLVLPELIRLELVKEGDAGPLEAMCEAYASWRAARDARVAGAPTVVQPSGRVAVNPAVMAERAASAEYRAWAREFGLTASSESGLSVRDAPVSEEPNPFATPSE